MRNYSKFKRSLVAALVTLAFASTSVFAQRAGAPPQTGQSVVGADIKGRAPVNKEILKVKLPKAQEATLSNGLRVVLLENHRVPTFSMQMVVMSGGLADPSNYHGLATFTAALLREGTATRKSKDIAEQIDTLGATLNAGAGISTFTTTITTAGLVENFDPTLDIFTDVIRNPKFPQEEVDKYKQRQIAQMQFQRSIPQFLAAERFQRAIYGEHPAGMIVPPMDSIKRITSADLAGFHSTNYRPNNAMLAIVGDVTLKEIMPKLERAFGDWQKADVPMTKIPAAPNQGPMRIQLIDRPGSVQTVLQLGNLGIERTNQDYFAVLVMNQILGGGPAARLFLNLREKNGYTYGAYSNFGGSKFRGTVTSSSEVRTDVTEGAMKEFMYELKRIRDEKVTPVELENAKRAIVGNFALSLEQPNALLQNIVTQKLYEMPADYWDTYPAMVAKITAEDVQAAAQKYVSLSNLQIVAVGDASKARDVLAKYGAVEVYDADGAVVPEGKKPTQ
ncbi:MAG: zinc protease [Acidobacteriota bacterium]|jgi:predicted Zn-dependent peptidase|nr:zinc protease [Acidobacteriota bacterium]